MSQLQGSSLAGLMPGGGAKLEAGKGGAEYARQSHRANGQSTQQAYKPMSYTPSFSTSFSAPSIFNQTASSSLTDPGYTNADWHSDLQFWGWEDKPVAGSGYMN